MRAGNGAAGNRAEDRAAVYEMPGPLANRLLHVSVDPDFDSFRDWAVRNGIDDRLIAFLAFRPQLLHLHSDSDNAWPSPRSWAMADPLLRHDIDLEIAVGPGAAAEFAAFIAVCTRLPDVEAIFCGSGKEIRFPSEPSLAYALTLALAMRWSQPQQFGNALKWMTTHCSMEWLRLFLLSALERARRNSLIGGIVPLIIAQPKLRDFKEKYAQYLAS